MEKLISSTLYTKASKDLEEIIKEELEIDDPELDTARAILENKDN